MTKRLLAGTLALSLLGGASALAQNDNHHRDDNGGGPGGALHGAQGAHGPSGGGAPHGLAPGGPGPAGGVHGGAVLSGGGHPAASTAGPGGHPAFQGGPQYQPFSETRHGGGPHHGPGPQNGVVNPGLRSNSPTTTHQGRPNFGVPGFRPAPGHAQPRYDQRFFPRALSAQRHFRWRGAWTGQPGYSYRRWNYGDRLPFGWFARQFWISDYDFYDLPIPPYGYVWVRAGPDALLVELDSGEVVEVVYGLFY